VATGVSRSVDASSDGARSACQFFYNSELHGVHSAKWQTRRFTREYDIQGGDGLEDTSNNEPRHLGKRASRRLRAQSRQPQQRPALENLPLCISVGGVAVTGRIVSLYPDEVKVTMTSPVNGPTKGLHVPYFAMKLHKLTVDGGRTTISAYWQELAESILKELFVSAR
jgi:hypothetical protein